MAPAADSAPKRVLVVDNEAGICALLREVLARDGLAVSVAEDGLQAFAELRGGGFDLLVTDLTMPGMNGGELIAALGELAAPPRVLIVSGFLDAATERSLGEHPLVCGVFRKPFDVFEFAQRACEIVHGGGG